MRPSPCWLALAVGAARATVERGAGARWQGCCYAHVVLTTMRRWLWVLASSLAIACELNPQPDLPGGTNNGMSGNSAGGGGVVTPTAGNGSVNLGGSTSSAGTGTAGTSSQGGVPTSAGGDASGGDANGGAGGEGGEAGENAIGAGNHG